MNHAKVHCSENSTLKSPKVSIIIPCYNAADYLQECIESCLSQTYTSYEIIIVNNNSTDHTIKIATDYQKKYPDIISLFHENKRGPSAARNKGLQHAKGDWIQFLDADDLLLPDKLAHQLSLISENDRTSIIIGHSIYQSADTSQQIISPNKNIYESLITMSGHGNVCSNLWSKKAVMQVEGFNESLANYEDPDLIFRIIREHTIPVYDYLALTIYRDINPTSQSKSADTGAYIDGWELKNKIIAFVKEEDPDFSKKYLKLAQNSLYLQIRLIAQSDIYKAFSFLKSSSFLSHPPYGQSYTYRSLFLILGFVVTEYIYRLGRNIKAFIKSI